MNNRQPATLCLLIGTLLLSACITASDLGEGLANESESILLKNQNNHYKHWNGIGKLFWNDEPGCTATLLDTRNSNNKAVGPAYLLTAAHCLPGVSGPRPPEPFKETVTFNYFNDTLNTSKSYTVKEALWSDYGDVDLAILELDVPLDTLLEQGITPLLFTSQWTQDVTDVLIVGAPERLPDAGLRLAACVQEPTGADLVEHDRISFTTFKNRCREIRPGSSGSPVLDRQTGRILSVLTTTTFGATSDEKCFQDAPCEVKDQQPAWSPDTHYSHPAEYLSSCFREGFFTSVANACATREVSFQVTDLKYWPTHYVSMPKEPTRSDPVLNAAFSLSSPYYRFKTARNALDCRSPHNYSDSIDAQDAAIKTSISRMPGMHYLCIVGIDSLEQPPSTERMKSAWIIPAQLVERTPLKMPEPTITSSAEGHYTVEWQYLLPTHASTLYYASPDKNVDCTKVAYEDFIETSEKVTFEAQTLPLMLCSRNSDLARRISKARTDLLALP